MASSEARENLSSSIGLQVGSKAPAFTFLDQFDRPQSNETLRGSNGTVIVFFRSADW
jgi:peroxiredoxin